MPYTSRKQQRKFHAMAASGEMSPKVVSEWDASTDFSHLPEKAGGKPRGNKTKKGFDMIADLAVKTANDNALTKLSSDAQVGKELLGAFSTALGLSPTEFVKRAYANPTAFVTFLKLASGHTPTEAEKKAMALPAAGSLPNLFIQKLSNLLGKSGGRAFSLGQKARRGVQNMPEGAFRGTQMGLGVAGGGIGGLMAAKATRPTPQTATETAQPVPEVPESPAGPTGPSGPVSGGAPGGGGMGGMSPGKKALLVGGGLGAGALGLGALLHRRRKQTGDKTAHDKAYNFMYDLAVKVAADQGRKQAMDIMVKHLDFIATNLPLEKTASVRAVQTCLLAGDPLSKAIKVAYPHLNGEQRGLLAGQMVRSAIAWSKQAMAGCGPSKPTVRKRTEWHGKASEGMAKLKEMS